MPNKRGAFLSSLALILLCLWFDMCRCPEVWKMMNGRDFPLASPASEKDASSDDENVLETDAESVRPDLLYVRSSGEEESWPKPVVISANYPPAETPNEDADQDDSVFRQVSFTADQTTAEAVSEAAAEEPAAAPSNELLSDVSEGGVHVHSSYSAAEFSEDSSPLDYESPSYEIGTDDSKK